MLATHSAGVAESDGRPETPLRRIRAERKLTQQALADLLERSRTQVSAWEYGRGMTEQSRAYVAEKLGVEPDALGPAYDPEQPRPHRYSRRGPLSGLRQPGQGLDTRPSHEIGSALPLMDLGGAPMPQKDPELLSALLQFWDTVTPDARLDTLAYIRRRRLEPDGVSGKASRG